VLPTGHNKGFRIVGAISQDLDLFRMPVELRIDTDGRTEEKRIDVWHRFSVFGGDVWAAAADFDRSRNRVLTNSSDIKLRSSILRDRD